MIRVLNEVNSKMWAWGEPLCTLEHKEYVCPFCSHGETIELHRESRKTNYTRESEFIYYLSCLGSCMSYDVFKVTDNYFKTSFDKQALEEALVVFQKMVDFSKNFSDYKKDLNFIL